MRGFGFIVFVAFACLVLQTQCAPEEYVTPRYISEGECDETCPKYPNAVCKVDCVSIDAEGHGTECVNHLYDNGKVVYCYE